MRLSNRLPKREKIFGPGRAVPLDRNAKVRIVAYVRGWNARHKTPGQHRGPITRAFMEVLEALLWAFHNSRTGRCFPSYEAIAARAECNRDTVYEAIKALEFARALTWQNRITHIQVRERDLFGKWATRRQVIRTSNAYVFRDPLPGAHGRPIERISSKSENPPGSRNQEIQTLTSDRRKSTVFTVAPPPLPEASQAETAAAQDALTARRKHSKESSRAGRRQAFQADKSKTAQGKKRGFEGHRPTGGGPGLP